MRYLLLFVAIGQISLATASADPLQEAASAALECQAEADPAERLECLDAAARQIGDALQLQPAAAEPAQQALPVAAAPAVKESAGKTAPFWARAPAPRPQPEEREAEPGEIHVTVMKATESFGRYTFTTSDGQVWRQTQNERVRLPAELPTPAKIKRRLTGNPSIQFPNVSRGYRVERLF